MNLLSFLEYELEVKYLLEITVMSENQIRLDFSRIKVTWSGIRWKYVDVHI